ncbi:hypothetical protein D9M70_584400 [compost metagenome]
MKPRHVETVGSRLQVFRLDFVQRHRRGIDDARTRRAILQEVRRNDRAGIEADRATSDQVAAAHRDQIRSPRAGADEMYRHI